ncbi:MAG: chemotaxis protein CheW [Pseudomonadota bacterium]
MLEDSDIAEAGSPKLEVVPDAAKTFMALTFDLDGERFAISVKNVQEVIDPLDMTLVPNADPFAPGLINVRGAVVPVLNLQHRLGVKEKEHTTDTRFVVIEAIIDEDQTNFAIIADSVHEVFEVDESEIHPAPALGMKWPPDYIIGIAQREENMIIFLDTEFIFKPVTYVQ